MNEWRNQDAEKRVNDLMREIGNVQTLSDTEDAELRQIAQRLAVTDLSHRSRIRARLYQQLKHAPNTHANGGNAMHITMKRSAARVAVMIALLVTVPVLTVLAQTILGQIGSVIVIDEQENLPQGESITVDQMEATPAPVSPDARQTVQTAPITSLDGAIATNLSAEAAASLAGFDLVRQPSALPTGYEFGGRIVLSGESTTVDSFWQGSGNSGEMPARVSISQSTGDFASTYRVRSQAQSFDVTIGDIPAVLVTNANLNDSDNQMFNLLLWEDGDYLYVMTSPSLSADQMLTLAESMYR